MLKFKYIIWSTFLILVILLCCEPFLYISLWWYVVLFSAFFWILLIGSFSMSWGLFLIAITSNRKSTGKKIAITFDDGPNPKYTPNVLQLLNEYGAKATFFCIGKHVKKYPELVKQIAAEGHLIGNHSYSHSKFIDFKSTEAWLQELKDTDQAIFNVLGTKPELFRPPYGVTTPHLAKALKVTGHQTIGWNIRSFDMALKNPKMILKRILTRIQPGGIILLHDAHEHIETVLEQLLQFLNQQEYQLVTIKELLHDD